MTLGCAQRTFAAAQPSTANRGATARGAYWRDLKLLSSPLAAPIHLDAQGIATRYTNLAGYVLRTNAQGIERQLDAVGTGGEPPEENPAVSAFIGGD